MHRVGASTGFRRASRARFAVTPGWRPAHWQLDASARGAPEMGQLCAGEPKKRRWRDISSAAVSSADVASGNISASIASHRGLSSEEHPELTTDARFWLPSLPEYRVFGPRPSDPSPGGRRGLRSRILGTELAEHSSQLGRPTPDHVAAGQPGSFTCSIRRSAVGCTGPSRLSNMARAGARRNPPAIFGGSRLCPVALGFDRGRPNPGEADVAAPEPARPCSRAGGTPLEPGRDSAASSGGDLAVFSVRPRGAASQRRGPGAHVARGCRAIFVISGRLAMPAASMLCGARG